MSASAPSDALVVLARFGLPGAPEHATGPLDPPAWRELVAIVESERLGPLLAEAAAAGALILDENQREEAFAAQERAMRVCVLLERTLLATAELLDDAGISFRVLKGPAVARLDYPDPAWRAFGDVDLLVPSAAYDETLAVLGAAGARRRFAEVRPGFDRRFGKGATLVAPDGTQLDVHRSFAAGPFGIALAAAELFAATDRVEVGGRELPALGRELRFLHACYHAALGDAVARVVALRDVAQLLLATPLDLDRARSIARGWRGEAVVARAVCLAWERLALEPGPAVAWAASYRPDRFESRALLAYTGASRSYATQLAAGLRAVNGFPAKAAYVRALLLPSGDYVARHDGGYAHRLRRAWRARSTVRVAR